MTISNAFSLVQIAQQGTSSALLETQAELAAATRDYNRAVAEGDLEAQALAMERIGIASAKVKELMDAEFFQGIQGFLVTIASIVTALGSVNTLLGKNSGILKFFKDIPALLKSAGIAAAILNPFTIIAAAALGAGFFISEFFRDTNEEFRAWQDNTKAILDDFFLVQIPLAVGNAAVALANFFLNDLPNWSSQGWLLVKDGFVLAWNAIAKALESGINLMITGFQSFINTIIRGINRIISGLNKLPGVSISKIAAISLPTISIPTIEAANGFQGVVNQPTLFLAGESGSESVSITPRGRSSSSGNNTIIINVQGSVVSENELMLLVDDYLKDNLKKRNFQGF